MANNSIDPVCGMTVDENNSISAEYQGHIYHFCSEACQHRFQSDPEAYVGRAA